jgi:amidophosphoribosyltransferase
LISDKLHEECGIFGIYSDKTANLTGVVYRALFSLQHRGQESAGIAVNHDRNIVCYKDTGLVSQALPPAALASLGDGEIAIGHVRYGTTGDRSRENAQPLTVAHIKGSMAIAHNGNLTNHRELRKELELQGNIFHTTSDTEVIAYLVTRERLTHSSIEEAVSAAIGRLRGAYSLVIMSPRKLIAVRDPLGFRPLCVGKMEGAWVFASESCALDSIGADFVRDIEPGEIAVIEDGKLRSLRDHCADAGGRTAHCVFEYIYFSRPDSVVDGASVHEARLRAGAFLAREHPVDADIVVGVPDSGLDAALGFSRESGVPYGMGFIKSKYVGRTFIAPGQNTRENMVRIKLNPIAAAVKGKRVILVDDSIVRGTTSALIVRNLRKAGAKEVHMRVSAPPFVNPCYYGTDIPDREHLMAANHSIEDMARLIEVDSLGYLSIESARKLPNCDMGLCAACFDGKYPSL